MGVLCWDMDSSSLTWRYGPPVIMFLKRPCVSLKQILKDCRESAGIAACSDAELSMAQLFAHGAGVPTVLWLCCCCSRRFALRTCAAPAAALYDCWWGKQSWGTQWAPKTNRLLWYHHSFDGDQPVMLTGVDTTIVATMLPLRGGLAA